MKPRVTKPILFMFVLAIATMFLITLPLYAKPINNITDLMYLSKQTVSHLQSTVPISWTLSFDSPSTEIRVLATYDGNLYAGGHSGDGQGHLYVYDGTAWADTDLANHLGVTVDRAESLQVFNNRLYVGTRINASGTTLVCIYYYDGANFTEDFCQPGQVGFSGIEAMTIHNNVLYAANGSRIGEVYQRNGDNNWVSLGVIEANSPVRALVSHNGSLYAGTGTYLNAAKVWRWDGTTWILVKNLTNDFGLNQDGVWSLASFNDNLYVGLAGPGYPSPIFAYDGANWAISTNIIGCNSTRLTVIGNELWAGTCNGQAYLFENGAWDVTPSTGEIAVFDLVQYGSFIYAATSSNGRIYYSNWQEPIALNIAPPTTANVGELVYVPIELGGVQASDDLRGAQVGIRVSNATILAPVSSLSPRIGNLFPTDSLTYSVALADGWDFMVTAPFSPTPPVSGTGIIVELPFYAQAEGCVNLTFTDHILTNGNAITISHQISTGQICLIDQGHLVGATYLQSRASGHYSDTLIRLEGPRGIYTTTTNATGNFTITDIDSGVYTATFTHPLFVNAIRNDIIITGQMTTTLPEVGLWGGDMNQDSEVDKPDWYICAAASIPVNDPAFDINGDNVTNIIDCTLVGSNIGRPNMSTTNPPKAGLMTLAQGISNLTADYSVGRVAIVKLGNGDMLLRAVDVNGQLYATGTRLGLPVGAVVTRVELRDGFAGGFLRWHQDHDNLFIVAAPSKNITLTRDTDIAFIHITGGEEVVIKAASPVGEKITYSIFLPLVIRN